MLLLALAALGARDAMLEVLVAVVDECSLLMPLLLSSSALSTSHPLICSPTAAQAQASFPRVR